MASLPHGLPYRSAADILSAIEWFDLEFRNATDWIGWEDNQAQKYAILHNDQIYPVKKIISLATDVPVSEFSGGSQANGYVGQRDFQVVNLRAFSWTIESGSVACKLLDKSAFLHHGTGIPVEIRPFFLGKELANGERQPITLVYQNLEYSAHIAKETEHSRTRLFWNSDFANLLKQNFPHHYHLYQQGQQPASTLILRLQRLKGFDSYQICFAGEVAEESLIADVAAEEIESEGIAKESAKEGSVKHYYGKRYERSPRNRLDAIRIHGLSCNACGFSFEKIYGARGADYIEVHHIKPIHTYEQEQHVNPRTDLITVCSNCHRMIHRDLSNILSIEAVRALISEFKGAASE
jgi:5-methylcytosine-specific restriction protein A